MPLRVGFSVRSAPLDAALGEATVEEAEFGEARLLLTAIASLIFAA
jgi:hypothetical protein